MVIRRSTFLDSVSLMRVSQEVGAIEGTESVSVVAGTPLNLELLDRQGFAIPDSDGVGPNDIVIAVRARDEDVVERAIEASVGRLRPEGRSAGRGEAPPPRSVAAAARRREDATLALISVPGEYAAYESARALDAGLDVLCFSTGPTLEEEVALKRTARDAGLLFMGPDCGTAILGGVGLGFANAVEEGPVGIVGASGTGIQAATCLLEQAGVGISHAIGVGGRDLSSTVGGAMSIRALELLAADEATEAILLISKSPDPAVANLVDGATRELGKPVLFAFPGAQAAGGLEASATLDEAVDRVVASLGAKPRKPEAPALTAPTPGAIRGLFCGGTLRDEALGIVTSVVGQVETELRDGLGADHALIDFGSERFTRGRPHPMIDPSLRNSIFEEQALDPAVGVVLIDVILGFGSHPDPAADLAPIVTGVRGERANELTIVVSLCGAERDPQGLEDQARRLRDTGALVVRTNADAARLGLEAAGLTGSES